MDKYISNQSNAVTYCLQELQKYKNYKWNNLKHTNKDRYTIVYGRDGNENIAILNKKAWFESFGDHGFINEVTGLKETGLGDSINVEHLKEFISQNVKTIYIVYLSGAVYYISVYEFLVQSHRWENKENVEVRSISIHLYNRLNKEKKSYVDSKNESAVLLS